jgi:hypothetical protein
LLLAHALVVAISLSLSDAVRAAPLAMEEPRNLCDRWAAIAAAEQGVPVSLLRAIARVETGRNPSGRAGEPLPWPWTINADGRGHWLATKDAAIGLARDRIAQGSTQIDVGCFQLNLKWHGRAFASLDHMIDPARNARYAARFLASLKAELGDWGSATAAYHSRTPALGRAYLNRIARIAEAPAPAETALSRAGVPGRLPNLGRLASPRRGGMPSASAGTLGSLVRLGTSRAEEGAAPGALPWTGQP